MIYHCKFSCHQEGWAGGLRMGIVSVKHLEPKFIQMLPIKCAKCFLLGTPYGLSARSACPQLAPITPLRETNLLHLSSPQSDLRRRRRSTRPNGQRRRPERHLCILRNLAESSCGQRRSRPPVGSFVSPIKE